MAEARVTIELPLCMEVVTEIMRAVSDAYPAAKLDRSDDPTRVVIRIPDGDA